jgi:hypothetical protein
MEKIMNQHVRALSDTIKVKDTSDPLLTTVTAFEAGRDFANRIRGLEDDERDALMEAVYNPHFVRLRDWATPAKSHKAAVGALRVVLAECEEFHAPAIATNLLQAAFDYFEAQTSFSTGGRSETVPTDNDFARAEEAVDHTSDPLAAALQRFSRTWKEFCAASDEAPDSVTAGLRDEFNKAEAALCKWDRPATSRESAAAAIRLVQEDIAISSGEQRDLRMLAAALGYLESPAHEEDEADRRWEDADVKPRANLREVSLANAYNLHDLHSDVHHLHELLGAIKDILDEMPYERNGKRDVELDRVSALSWIATDRCHQLANLIEGHYVEIGTTCANYRSAKAS